MLKYRLLGAQRPARFGNLPWNDDIWRGVAMGFVEGGSAQSL